VTNDLKGNAMTAERRKAVAKELISNGRFRVTEWRFTPGAETGWHRHAHDYVVVPLTTGRLLVEENGANRYAELRAGEPYARQVGVEHNVINASEGDFVFLEIEAV
jgi:quercetin dioxygenase-like cupin family protein